MITVAFTIMIIAIFGRLLGLAMKATWGIIKVVFNLVFLPLVIIGLAYAGLMYIAFPVLIVIGVVSLIKPRVI